MVSGTLYTYPNNFRAYKSLIAAKYSGANVKQDPDFVFGTTNKTEEFTSKFPLGKVPAYEDENGSCITESNAIAYYVGNDQLRGTTALFKAQIMQWISFADSEILPPSCTWVFPTLGIMPYNNKTTDKAKEDLKKALDVLNQHLLTCTYLVGERITLADISVCMTLLLAYQHVLEPAFREPYRNTNRWFNTIINQPEVKEVIGEFKLCEKMAEFDGKKFKDMQTKLHGGQQQAPKAEKPKKEKKEPTPKKDVPKKEKKAAPEPEDDDDMPEVPKEKPKDPFEAFDKGSWNMDDFKRSYSNEDENVSIPYFWEKFDKEHYSIWYGEYMYPEDLTQVFMSCNLIGGMFQRLDKMRKCAFGSMCLFGENNNSTISGIFVWRSHELAFKLSPDWQVDYESYKWEKLDPDSDNTKKLVDQYFRWSGTDKDGRKFNQGKIFK